MKVFIIESEGKSIITTSQDVMLVAQDAFRQLFQFAFTGEKEIVSSLQIESCQLINPTAGILTVDAKIIIGDNIAVTTTAGINYDGNDVSVHNVTSTINDHSLSEWVITKTIAPLIQEHMNVQFKPEIHNFFTK